MKRIEEIKGFINNGCYHSISWDDMVNGFSDEELELMREYYLNSDIPLVIFHSIKNECVMDKVNMICVFMRLMACEYLIDDDIPRARNICSYFD